MLLYHPAYDLFHCVFRLLRLASALPRIDHEVVRIRILDFYLLFPDQLRDLQFPREFVRYKRQFQALENKYNSIEDPFRIFTTLEPYQSAALACLGAYGFISASALQDGKVRRTEMEIPTGIQVAMAEATNTFPALIELLSGPLASVDLYGKSGLKARSDLFEHRYDPT